MPGAIAVFPANAQHGLQTVPIGWGRTWQRGFISAVKPKVRSGSTSLFVPRLIRQTQK